MVSSTDSEHDKIVKRLYSKIPYSEYPLVVEINGGYVAELKALTLDFKNIIRIDSSAAAFLAAAPRKVVIREGVIKSKIMSGQDLIPIEDCYNACRYFYKPAINTKRFKEKKWDGYRNLFSRVQLDFPTGLTFLIEEVLNKKNIPYTIIPVYDKRPPKQFEWEVNDVHIIPDPDQLEAVRLAMAAGRCVTKAPTGFGKTAILAKRLVAGFGVPSLFLANKKSLLDDAKDEFLSIEGLSEVGKIMDGCFDHTIIDRLKPGEAIPEITSPVIVATIQSLHARLADPRTRSSVIKWLSSTCKFVMVDETQAVGTDMWTDVLNTCAAPYRVFLSATPRRTDGGTLEIFAQSGSVAFTTTAAEQIEKGRLSEVKIAFHAFDHKLYNEKDANIDYASAYSAFIVDNDERNQNCIIEPAIKMAYEHGRHVLILINYIEHGERLHAMLIERGIPEEDIRFIYGKTKNEARKRAISEFRKGEFKILIGSTIFDAGVNIPIISGVIIAGAGNSDITQVQRIGRGVRNADYEDILGFIPDFMKESSGKKVTLVHEILDQNVKFFERQAWNRYNISKEEFGKSRTVLVGWEKRKKIKPLNSFAVSGSYDMDEKMRELEDIFGGPDSSEVEYNSPIDPIIASLEEFFKED